MGRRRNHGHASGELQLRGVRHADEKADLLPRLISMIANDVTGFCVLDQPYARSRLSLAPYLHANSASHHAR